MDTIWSSSSFYTKQLLIKMQYVYKNRAASITPALTERYHIEGGKALAFESNNMLKFPKTAYKKSHFLNKLRIKKMTKNVV